MKIISIVIPVYNEAEHLGACLEAIAEQTVAPLEVIVVDNNSTDASLAIARSYPFVSVLSEERQGVVHARNRGFDAAKGVIIGRIDADTRLPRGWVGQLQAIFADQTISAVSGAPHYYDFAFSGIADGIDWQLRGRLSHKLGNNNFLWGANMAVRRSAWQRVRPLLCQGAQLHEDFDLGIHMQVLGMQVAYDARLVAGVSSRRIDTNFIDYVHYSLISPRTYAWHGLPGRRHMYPVLLACWLGYVPGRLIYRGYNPLTGSFSWNRLLAATPTRVDPTTNIA